MHPPTSVFILMVLLAVVSAGSNGQCPRSDSCVRPATGDSLKSASGSSKEKLPNPREVVEARISLDFGGTFVELRITDSAQIKELVVTPLKNARRDAKPAKYKIMGTLTTRVRTGAEETMILFRHWGRINRGGKYVIADFTKLQKFFKESLKDAKGWLE